MNQEEPRPYDLVLGGKDPYSSVPPHIAHVIRTLDGAIGQLEMAKANLLKSEPQVFPFLGRAQSQIKYAFKLLYAFANPLRR